MPYRDRARKYVGKCDAAAAKLANIWLAGPETKSFVMLRHA